jgi:hypothetical protein
MIVPVFVCGAKLASFDGRPGYRPQSLVVPGGSELLVTVLGDRPHRLLFVPTKDPAVRMAWTARTAVQAARAGCSSFRLIEAPMAGNLR